LIRTINSILQIDNIASVDLVDEITLIDTIDKILQIDNIASIDLIDAITRIETIGIIESMTLLERITQIDKIHPDLKEIEYIEIVCPEAYGGMWPAIDDISLITISPEEEQMTNGGFETGDFTGYTYAEDTVQDTFVHTGTYAARLTTAAGNYLRQTFATSIPVANVKSLTFWAIVWLQYTTFANVIIGYTDGTTQTIPVGEAAVGGWEQWDLTEYLEAEGAHTVIDRVAEITSMPDLTITTLPEVEQSDASKLKATVVGTVTVEQSDETKLNATVTQAEKDRTVTGTVTAEQTARTDLKVQPEREDLISLGGVVSPNNAGVEIVAPSGTLKVKVYDAGYHGAVDGLHYFYFGTDTTATTKRLLTANLKGLVHKTFVQPRIGAAGDGLYLFSSVSETNMPYDVGYVQEA
ncbi:hypothetical protein KKE60_04235, partial [Patescibacteria group bacterium]|nr:hypothetical protein [Patescibacteria group bacterium]